VPSEVIVQCFFRLERDHFDHLRLQEIGELSQISEFHASTNSDSPRSLSSNPSPERIDEEFVENRRLLMSILVLAQFAIVLG
jgi:hypothetical protein